MNLPAKTYVREFSAAMLAYVLLLVVTLTALPLAGQAAWRFGLVLLPVAPAIWMMRAFLRYLEQLDELQQRIQLVGIGFAAGLTALLSFTYGFLELAGLPHIPWLWVFPLMVMLWGLGVALASRRYE